MSLIPRVTERAREHVAREFDTRGPNACMAEVIDYLEKHNPELLHMSAKCAADLGNSAKAMVGFSIFFRLLIGQLPAGAGGHSLMLLPRVSPDTRALLVKEIDAKGTEAFTRDAIAELDETNPELLQMAHNFASGLPNYLHAMQGFALLYKALLIQSAMERTTLH